MLVFHFFHLLSCCLSFSFSFFWLRGWLMWVYPTVQAVNVDLSMQSVINPSTQKPSFHPTYLSAHLQLTYNSPFLLSCSSKSRCIHLTQEQKKKTCFLELPSERNFDFMVLIIFLRNHSRIKHKDAEIVPLSDAPQWGCLVKKTTRSSPPPPPPLLPALFF